MKRTALCFLSLTLLYFSLVAHGQKVDHTTGQAPPPTKNVGVSDIQGTELLRSCNMPFGTIGFQFCEAFIVGVRDGVWGRRQHDSRAGKTAGGATSQLESRTEGQNPEELEVVTLAQNRRVDITLSSTGQQSIRQFPFNAEDALTLLSAGTKNKHWN
jgi:hypothetical protein